MIELRPVPSPEYIFAANIAYNTPKHIFDLSEYDIKIYYYTIFENRSKRNALYINKYNSLEELKKDIYGRCAYHRYGDYTVKSFKEIYHTLDKEELLSKINAMIEQYGNAAISDDNIDICIKTDEEPFRLRDWLEYIEGKDFVLYDRSGNIIPKSE